MKNRILANPRSLLFLAMILIAWRLVLFIDLPLVDGDGPWWLSQTFSLIRGDFLKAPFGFSYIDPYLNPYMYAIITAPFFFVFRTGYLNIILFNFILIVAFVILAWVYLSQTKSAASVPLLFVFLILTSPYIYNMREEILNIDLILVSLIVWDGKWSLIAKICVNSFLVAIVGLVHPVGGVFLMFLSIMLMYLNRYSFKHILVYVFLAALIVACLYLPVILQDFDYWKQSFFPPSVAHEHRPTLDLFAKFVALNPFIFAAFGFLLIRVPIRKLLPEIMLFILAVLVITLFGKSYYYPYLFAFILWRVRTLPDAHPQNYERYQVFIIAILVVAPVLSHYLPTFQQAENRAYSNQYRRNLLETERYRLLAETSKVYVPVRLGMPIISQQGSRGHHSCSIQARIKLEGSDVIIIDHIGDYECLLKIITLPDSQELDLVEAYPPVPGLLTLSSLFQSRSAQLGLWTISLK